MILQRLKEALFFWRRHLGALFLISAPFAVFGEAVQWALGPVIASDGDGQITGINAVSVMLLLLIRPLAEGALVMQMAAIQQDRARGLWACVAPALSRYPLLLGTYFLMGVAVSLGWMLLFLPAFWAYARLCFAPFRVMLRGDPPLTALKAAFERSGPCQWPLLLSVVLAGLLVFVVAGLVNGLITGLLGDHPGALLISGLVAGLAATLINVVAFRFWVLHDPVDDPQ